VIAALFHDLGKVGYPGKPHYLPNGIYPVPGGVNNLNYHHRECRLQMIVRFADKWTAAVDEEGRRPDLYLLHQQSHLLRPRQLAL
jgi:hypothetical protein